ncbi:hypothetical protein ACFL0D_08455 [Thermoproteota archaeon]
MNEKTIREELFEIIMESDLPDDLTIDKILIRAYEFQKVNLCISFIIVRHPGLGSRKSSGKGIGLSAYWEEKTRYTYHLGQEKWDVEVLSSTLEYEADFMAREEVNSLEEGGFFPSEIQDKEELIVIVSKAQKVIKDHYLETWSYDTSEKFFEMLESLSEEMKKIIEKKYTLYE